MAVREGTGKLVRLEDERTSSSAADRAIRWGPRPRFAATGSCRFTGRVPSFQLQTVIAAPIGDCFTLSLSVDAHAASMSESGEADGTVQMTDVVEFRSPLGLLGSAADRLVLGHYMPHLLRQRNAWLKNALETRD